MRLYLDSSAIVKLVQLEAESPALRRFLRRHREDERVTSALARSRALRAVDSKISLLDLEALVDKPGGDAPPAGESKAGAAAEQGCPPA